MDKNGSYGTDNEILAAASLMKCNIYVFDTVSIHQNSQWKVYNSMLETGDASPGVPSLLIHHTRNHYNPVYNIS